ncbi:MAG: hypothetical protein LBL00_09270 [Endomicrobium sp.]|jgi:hypothetical protein|nr:hypothetical protein [Endomicrobium sp.]
MKKFLTFSAVLLALAINACSNPKADKPEPPAPKPDNYIDAAAVAAKKADFYVRLAFDLADGYLSDQSVVRKKYGKDAKYVESLDFGRAKDLGEISSSNISKPVFKYWYRDEYSVETVLIYPDILPYPTRDTRRGYVMGRAGGTYPTYQYDIEFTQTDLPRDEALFFPVQFTAPGFLASKGASINISAPFELKVESSLGPRRFNVTVVNVSGIIKVVKEGHKPSPADEFIIKSGKIIISGTDPDYPHAICKIELEYSDDKANNPSNFTVSSGTVTTTYTYNIDKDSAYYTKDSEPSRKYYAYWDYPL